MQKDNGGNCVGSNAIVALGVGIALLLLFTACTPKNENLLAHWKCGDGHYEQLKEKCYTDKCIQNEDCEAYFYGGMCGRTEGVFPKRIEPPEFVPKRCNKDVCSFVFSECFFIRPTIVVPVCEKGKCIEQEKPMKEVFIGNKTFHVAVAETKEEQEYGLKGIQRMDENEGMLFVFDKPGKYSFWMKGALIPLDMIFINEKREIVSIQHAEPCRREPCQFYTTNDDVLYVVEVNKGAVDGMVGKHAEFSLW